MKLLWLHARYRGRALLGIDDVRQGTLHGRIRREQERRTARRRLRRSTLR